MAQQFWLQRSSHLENSPPTTRTFSSSNGIGTPDDFTMTIQLPWQHDFNRVCVTKAAIPRSMYAVQKNQDYFTVQEDTKTYRVTVPVRNYTLAAWMTTLTSALNAASAVSGFGYTYDVDYDDGTGKFEFFVAGNGAVLPRFIVTTFMYNMLGFLPNSTNTFTNDTVDYLHSTTMVNLNPVPVVYLRSDIVWQGDSRNPDLLEELHVIGIDGSWIGYTCPDIQASSKKMAKIGNSNVFRFYFRDALGNAVDFNGQPVYLSLLFYRDDRADSVDKFVVPTKQRPLYP